MLNKEMVRIVLMAFVLGTAQCVLAAEIAVGPEKAFSRLEDAVAAARAGDAITVYPLPDNRPYEKTAIFIATPRLSIRAQKGHRVGLSGRGFDYSGKGRIPRAIVQFGPGASGSVLDGFELFDAHNDSFNGAGVRIVQANDVSIRNCDIHDNDMGIMSSGDPTSHAAAGQLIESCRIHANGTIKDPGYNHNLYLGGTSVRVIACEIFGATTGHNLKSRAHQTFVLNCFIHDSANRELDLVDSAGDTTAPDSDAVLVGNVIVKDPRCAGNRGVIHFGQDGGHEHDGTIWLANNTILTPFISPVLMLSAPKASVRLFNNIICNTQAEQKHSRLVELSKVQGNIVVGQTNWLSGSFADGMPEGIAGSILGPAGKMPAFVDPAGGDFHLLRSASALIDAGTPLPEPLLKRLNEPLFEYHAPLGRTSRGDDGKPDIGAYELAR